MKSKLAAFFILLTLAFPLAILAAPSSSPWADQTLEVTVIEIKTNYLGTDDPMLVILDVKAKLVAGGYFDGTLQVSEPKAKAASIKVGDWTTLIVKNDMIENGDVLVYHHPTSSATPVETGSLTPNTTDSSIGAFLTRIKDYLLGFVGAAAILFIIYGGVQFMTSSGNPKKIETAKKTLTYAIGGLIVVLLSQGFYLILTGSLSKILGFGTL